MSIVLYVCNKWPMCYMQTTNGHCVICKQQMVIFLYANSKWSLSNMQTATNVMTFVLNANSKWRLCYIYTTNGQCVICKQHMAIMFYANKVNGDCFYIKKNKQKTTTNGHCVICKQQMVIVLYASSNDHCGICKQ